MSAFTLWPALKSNVILLFELICQPRFQDVRQVAAAFITNLSGGAACYELDLGLVAKPAISPALTDAIANMRRLMAFADTAGWQVIDDSDKEASSVVIVARASNGTGENASTASQEFTLHVDLTETPPITRIDASQRVNKSSSPEWVMMPSHEDVAAMAALSRAPVT